MSLPKKMIAVDHDLHSLLLKKARKRKIGIGQLADGALRRVVAKEIASEIWPVGFRPKARV